MQNNKEFSDQDKIFMQRAFELGVQASLQGEVPVGAILVLDNQIIGEGFNSPISQCDPSAHAEMLVLRTAAKKIGNYRLANTILYVTLEPCMMCVGAMVHARIKRLVYGATDPKAGAVMSKAHCFDQSFLNHHVEYVGGLMAEACGNLLGRFFQDRRDSG